MKKNIPFLIVAIISIVSVLLISCGSGNNGGSKGGETTGSIALYVTDDLTLEYDQVIGEIIDIQLFHTGSEAECDLLTSPVTLDITDLSSMIQLLNVSECVTGNYNRIRLEFSKNVTLTDMNNTSAACTFSSYKDTNDIPNRLHCSGDSCFIDINGGINVLSNQLNELALDFDLKKFEVTNFNDPSCAATMKVNPLNKSGIKKKHNKGYDERIAGYIAEIDKSNREIILTTESGTFNVDYANVININIESLLDFAYAEEVEVIIEASTINLTTHEINALNIHTVIPKKPLAKNIIIMITDGWGFNHLEAASYYEYGKDARQIYNRFPFNYAMSTYMAYNEAESCYGQEYDPYLAWSEFDYVQSCSTDSAAAATAMSTGVKTYQGAIGVNLNKEALENILEVADELGKKTGVVSSVQFSHATPASFVAHNESRNNYTEIAREMIYDSAVDVIMGTGHPWYDNNGRERTTPATFQYVGGENTWNDLVAGIAGGDADADGIDDPWTLIQTRDEFQSLVDNQTPQRVIGIPQVSQTLQQGRSGDAFAVPYAEPLIETVPTLEEMTKGALNILDDDPDGLFLMVEGGAVDWASHSNQSGRMIEEQIEFERAVEAVVEWVKKNSNWGETLLIVTGDHETGYLTGPGSDPNWEPIVNYGVGILPGMQWNSNGHTNSLIVLSAKGDAARLFHDYSSGKDLVRGPYVDNTSIAEVVFKTMASE